MSYSRHTVYLVRENVRLNATRKGVPKVTPVSVHDVAAYILKKCGGMSTMKLQKLCYYGQGWSLAWDGEPLFTEDVQAWANGPVCYELFKGHRGQFSVSKWPKGKSSRLSTDQKETLDAILDSYGQLTGQQLSEKSHGERPWLEARGGLTRGAASSAVISLDAMQDFFGALAADEPDEDEAYDEYRAELDREAFLASADASDFIEEDSDDYWYSAQ